MRSCRYWRSMCRGTCARRRSDRRRAPAPTRSPSGDTAARPRRPLALSPSRAERLQDLPAALPVPRGRPTARAAERAGRPRHAGARGAGADVRPARPPSGRPSAAAASIGPVWERDARGIPGAARAGARRGPRRVAGVGRGSGPDLLHPRGSAPVRPGGLRVRHRDRDRRRGPAARLRRPARPRADRASCGSSTTRPAAPPIRISRRRRCTS